MDEITSPTLLSATPKRRQEAARSACATCPHAIWFQEADSISSFQTGDPSQEPRIFCRLMHATVAQILKACDGRTIEPPQPK